MKITVETGALSRELFKVTGVIPSKSPQPAIQNALLEVQEDGTLTIHATDYDLSMKTSLACQVHKPGRAAVRGKDLHDAIKSIKSMTVTLEREDNYGILLTAGSVRARLIGMDPDEFPTIPKHEDVAWVSLDTRRLVRMIERTIFSVSTDEGRPHLTGALLKLKDESTLMMVSTDGHRLSKMESRTARTIDDAPDSLHKGMIIPRKGLSELRRSVDVTAESIDLGLSGSTAIFRFGHTDLLVRVIDGTFPNFQQVIPQEDPDRRAMVKRSELMERIRFVSLFANSKTYNIRLQLDAEGLVISAHDPDKGECEERIEITYTGPEVRAGFNYRYLLDVLGAIEGEEISMEVIDTLSPTILREVEGEDGDDALFIVMPMRI